MDWEIALRANKEIRAQWMKKASHELQPKDKLPEDVRKEFVAKCSDTVQEGIESLERAIVLDPEYDDAMAYLNLLYRQKADRELNTWSRDENLKTADDFIQLQAIQKKKMEQRQEP